MRRFAALSCVGGLARYLETTCALTPFPSLCRLKIWLSYLQNSLRLVTPPFQLAAWAQRPWSYVCLCYWKLTRILYSCPFYPHTACSAAVRTFINSEACWSTWLSVQVLRLHCLSFIGKISSIRNVHEDKKDIQKNSHICLSVLLLFSMIL